MIFRTNPVIFRINTVTFRTNPVTYQVSVVIHHLIDCPSLEQDWEVQPTTQLLQTDLFLSSTHVESPYQRWPNNNKLNCTKRALSPRHNIFILLRNQKPVLVCAHPFHMCFNIDEKGQMIIPD